MASNATKLGGGYALGMFYHAPKGTALPSYPSEELAAAWTLVGDVTEEGITWHTARDYETLKNWALKVKRVMPGTDPESVKVPIMDTTEEVFKVIFGESAVTKIAADTTHGNVVKVDTSPLNTPDEEAYLFIMKDGDDMIALGSTGAFISAVDDVAFKATEGITWNATISGDFELIMDDGQTT